MPAPQIPFEQLVRRQKELHQLHISAARQSSAAHASYVMRDEAGKALKLARIHREWHSLFATVDRLILWGSAEVGKTKQLVSYITWRVGRDPSIRVVIVSKNKGFARKIMRGVAGVLTSPQYRDVFPGSVVLQANGDFIDVLGFDGVNHTVEAVQFFASIHGARIDLLIFDDVLDRLNTRTEYQREAMFQFYKDAFISRLTERAQVIFAANAWHPRDMLHRLQAEPGWTCRRYPIRYEDKDGVLHSIWPEHWPLERIAERELEYAKDKLYFRRVYLCEPLDDRASSWDRRWIQNAESHGFGLPWPERLSQAYGEQFRQISIGVDLATKRPASRRQTDESVLCVVGQYHDGRKRPLYMRSGRWHGPQIVAEIKDVRDRFHPAIPWVESVAAQMYIVDYCKEPQRPAQGGWIGMEPEQARKGDPIPVRCFETTARRKYDPTFGIEALGVEMSCGIWLFPNTPGKEPPIEYQKLLDEMMSYDANAHTGDRLMAFWIASEGLRLGMGGADVVDGSNGRGR